MEKFDINQIDVKTMRLMLSIWSTRTVSEAAAIESLSQSTASYRLERLRHWLNDPVFVRGANGMEPTVLGMKALEAFTVIIDEVDQLTEAKTFNPAMSTRDFVVAASAIETEVVLTGLQHYLMNHAPGCRLIVRPMVMRDIVESLNDHLDLALLSVPPKSSVIKQVLLFNDELVTYYDPDVRDAPASIDDFCHAQHAVASLGGTATSGVDVELRKINRKRNIKLEVSNLESLAPLMGGTSLITTIPKKLSFGLMKNFKYVSCPLTFPLIPFHAIWHLSKDQEPANQWLRRAMRIPFES